jgi:hypothetical protein
MEETIENRPCIQPEDPIDLLLAGPSAVRHANRPAGPPPNTTARPRSA